MKVLMWCDGNIHNQRWLSALRNRNVVVRTVGWEWMRIPDENDFLAVCDRVRLGRLPKVGRWQLAKRLQGIGSSSEYDLIQIQFPTAELVGMAKGGHPVCIHLWGSEINRIYPCSSRGAKISLQKLLGSAEMVTAYSPDLLDGVKEYIRPSAIQGVIELNPDLKLFQPAVDKSDSRKRIGLATDRVLIISPRGIGAVYRTREIILACANLLRKQVNVALVQPLYGPNEPEYLEECRRLVRSLGIEEKVLFIPRRAYFDMPALYQAADLIINFPSLDGGPATIKEAMACGCCIISSGLRTYRGLLRHMENAFLIDSGPDEVEKLDQAISKMISCQDIRAVVMEGARRTAQNFHPFDEQFEWVVEGYREIIRMNRDVKTC